MRLNELGQRSAVLTSGRSVGEKIATGRARVIKSAQFLVEQGIDSISLNPDTVLKTGWRFWNKRAPKTRKT